MNPYDNAERGGSLPEWLIVRITDINVTILRTKIYDTHAQLRDRAVHLTEGKVYVLQWQHAGTNKTSWKLYRPFGRAIIAALTQRQICLCDRPGGARCR